LVRTTRQKTKSERPKLPGRWTAETAVPTSSLEIGGVTFGIIFVIDFAPESLAPSSPSFDGIDGAKSNELSV
jgi:hypothetical protein